MRQLYQYFVEAEKAINFISSVNWIISRNCINQVLRGLLLNWDCKMKVKSYWTTKILLFLPDNKIIDITSAKEILA